MVTDAEAIRQLRGLLVSALAQGAGRHEVRFMAETVAEIARDGVDPIIELRIRRFHRLWGAGPVGNGQAV